MIQVRSPKEASKVAPAGLETYDQAYSNSIPVRLRFYPVQKGSCDLAVGRLTCTCGKVQASPIGHTFLVIAKLIYPGAANEHE